MTSFTDIPLDDIKEFLISNNKSITSKPYLDAWNLIKDDRSLTVPPSISDFFLAQNLSKLDFDPFKMSKILTSDVQDLIYITALQDLPKNRIIRVLKYLNKLDNDMDIFDMLPKDISQMIVSKLDIRSIKLICEISCNFSKFCQTHLRPILLKNLKCKTDADINNFSIKQLISLYDNHNLTIKSNYHSLILKDNKIYNDDEVVHPKIFDDIIQIATSNNHALVLTADGEVYSFGNNDLGQLGLGHNFECNIPQLINNISDVIQISVSDRHSMLLTSDRNVYVCGNSNNLFKQLELGNVIKISAGFSHSLALTEDGKIYLIDLTNSVKLLMENSEIISISTGYDHSLFLDRKGLIYAYGNNEYGQLGPNIEIVETPNIITGLDNIVHIVAGNKYSLVLTNEGEVFKFGLEDDKINYDPIKVNIANIIKA
jgi:hypothetical protein